MSFEAFVQQRRADLQRISRKTCSEHSLADVINEAWLMAEDLRIRKGVPTDFLNRAFQDLLISHLYQHLVRYTDVNVRYGVRLDHAAPGEEEAASHWLMLFRHFRNDMRSVATYLLISRSWAYRCCARARMLVECQHPLPRPATAALDRPFPRPWRKARFFRGPVQLLLPFDEELPLAITSISIA